MWLLVIAGVALASFQSQSACDRAKKSLAGMFERAYHGQLIGLTCRKGK